MRTLTARELAERQYSNFDWCKYDELEHEAAQAAIEKLNHRQKAPLGRQEPKTEIRIDNRTELEKMEDKANQQTGKALIQAQQVGIQSKEDMAKAVEVAYSANGNNALQRHQVMAIAALCWELGLSPNPTLGHVYGFENGGKFMVMMGIYGLINLARRDHEFVLQDAREMNEQERQQYGLKTGDVGVMVGIIDGREVATFSKIVAGGIPVKVEDMYHWYPGIWRAEVERYDKKQGKKVLKPEDIPNTWTAFQVAEKRAVRTALKRLGLNSNVGRLPNVPGYKYDIDEGAYVYEPEQIEAGQSETPAPAPEPIEGVFEEMLATQVEAEQARESAVVEANVEPAEEAHETPEPTPAPAPAPAASEAAETVAETAAPDPDLLAVDVGKLLKLYAEEQHNESVKIESVPTAATMLKMLKNVVKDLSDNKASDFLKAVRGKDTLGGVTTEEWRGLLAVINSKPDLMVIAAMTDKKAKPAAAQAAEA